MSLGNTLMDVPSGGFKNCGDLVRKSRYCWIENYVPTTTIITMTNNSLHCSH